MAVKRKGKAKGRACPMCKGSGWVTEWLSKQPPIMATLEQPCTCRQPARRKGKGGKR